MTTLNLSQTEHGARLKLKLNPDKLSELCRSASKTPTQIISTPTNWILSLGQSGWILTPVVSPHLQNDFDSFGAF